MNHQIRLDITGLSKELRVLLELLKRDNERYIEQNHKQWFADLDWSLFLELAQHHRIFPMLFLKLKQMAEIPNHVIESLSQQYRKNTFRMLHLSAEMNQISRFFIENKVRLLHLKGPVLATDLYGDLSLRTCSDLDMLVSIDDVDRVDQFLLDLGYEKDDYIETVLGDWKWRHHHVTYFHSQKSIKIEIHWRLNPGPGYEPSFDELWERKRASSITNTPIYYLEREDLFFFLVTHGARHGWSRIRWLMDINEILKQELDWKKLEERMTEYHSLHIGGQALILSSQLLNSPLVEETNPFIRGSRPYLLAQEAVFYFERMVNLHSSPVEDEVATYHRKHLFHLMSAKQKTLFIFSFLYPYPEDVDTLPLPEKLHFLYFPLRPILWTWRKSMKQTVSKRRVS